MLFRDAGSSGTQSPVNFGYTSLIFCLTSVSFAIIGGGGVTIQAGMLTWPLVSS